MTEINSKVSIETPPEVHPFGDRVKFQRSKLVLLHTEKNGSWAGYAYKAKIDAPDGHKVEKGGYVYISKMGLVLDAVAWSDLPLRSYPGTK